MSPRRMNLLLRLPRSATRQRGVVLIISLIVLVALTLAGVAMMRTIDNGTMIVGNLALKNATTYSADAAIEAARQQLTNATPTQLNADGYLGAGYFANWQAGFSPVTNNNWTAFATDVMGNQIWYAVHRMCAQSGVSSDATQCVKQLSTSTGSTHTGGTYGAMPLTGTALVYYRITAKVVGAKNTVSYVQAFVY